MSNAGPTDEELYAGLRDLWSAVDPVPDGLVDDVLLRLAPELDVDIELLALQERADLTAGLRSGQEPTTFTFALDDVEVLLRITPLRRQRRRVDGWAAPRASGSARITIGGVRAGAVVDANGRFEFDDVASGLAVLDLRVTLSAGVRVLRTPPFEI